MSGAAEAAAGGGDPATANLGSSMRPSSSNAGMPGELIDLTAHFSACENAAGDADLTHIGERVADRFASALAGFSGHSLYGIVEPVTCEAGALPAGKVSVVQFGIQDVEDVVFLLLGPQVAGRVTAALFGAPPEEVYGYEEGQRASFTSVDEKVLAHVADAFAAGLGGMLQARAGLRLKESGTKITQLPATWFGRTDSHFGISFRASEAAAAELEMKLLLPKSLSPALLSTAAQARRCGSAEAWRRSLHAALLDVEIGGRAVLAERSMAAARLTGLRTGEELFFAADGRVTLLLEGVPVALCEAGEQNGRRALRAVRTLHDLPVQPAA